MRRLAVGGFVALAVGLALAPGALAATGAQHAAAPATGHAAAAGVNSRSSAASLASGNCSNAARRNWRVISGDPAGRARLKAS